MRNAEIEALPSWIIRERYFNAPTREQKIIYRSEWNERRGYSRPFLATDATELSTPIEAAERIARAPEIVIAAAQSHGALRSDGRIPESEVERQREIALAEDAEPEPELRTRTSRMTIELPEYLAISLPVIAKLNGMASVGEWLAFLLDGISAGPPTSDGPIDAEQFDDDLMLDLERTHPGFTEAVGFFDGRILRWPEEIMTREAANA